MPIQITVAASDPILLAVARLLALTTDLALPRSAAAMAGLFRRGYIGAMVDGEPYREATYVEERCTCDEPAVGHCPCCRRVWCEFHRMRGLCFRCDRTIDREMEGRWNQRMFVALGAEVAVTVGMLLMHSMAGFFLGMPLALVAFIATPRVQRRWLLRRLAPRLATTTGELPLLRAPDQFQTSKTSPVSGMSSFQGFRD